MRIIGIDPGLTKTGVGIIDIKGNNLSYVASKTIRTDTTLDLADRLHYLHKELIEIIKEFTPTIAAIEETFVNKNPISSLKLGHARGTLMLTLAICGLKVREFSATSVKKAIVGVGRADKNQIQVMVKMLLPQSDIDSEDEADALAVAICCNNNIRRF
ncbi:MAG: crossover junction endodeoxyribonuclease RuvC [Rickettsiales bacterium]|nr:crossover junction endodeoxyribonuclease RuvC [Rickettsiales bacterium]